MAFVSQGPLADITHTTQTLSTLVLDTDLFVPSPCLLPEDSFTCLLSVLPRSWQVPLLVLKGTCWLYIAELDKGLTYTSGTWAWATPRTDGRRAQLQAPQAPVGPSI